MCKEIKINDNVQKYNDEYYRFDIDSSPESYKLYEKIYHKSIKDKYCISTPKFFRYIRRKNRYIDAPDVALINRLYALPKGLMPKESIVIGNREYEVYQSVDRLSGDCFFNFNEKKEQNLKKISGIDKGKLKKCCSMHHSIYNMVLLQTKGNMQQRKQEGLKLNNKKFENYDRGDTFLYFLYQFYNDKNKERSEIIQSQSSSKKKSSAKKNKEKLIQYLLNFENVEDYSSQMLQISDIDFIRRMIENGKRPLRNCVNEYLDIALEFWRLRKEKIDLMISNSIE